MAEKASKYIPFLDPNREGGKFMSEDIGTDTLLAVDIAAGAVGASELATDAVETAKIKDANVTTAKIADANVTTVKIADANVTVAKIAADAVTNVKVAAAAAIAGSKISPDVTNAIIGIAAGYKIARGETSVTGTADIAAGLATVVQVVACLENDVALDGAWVSVADSATAGNIILKVWKPTSATDCTPIAATVAKSVRWIAIGT